jgi:hypothetical protein
MNYVQVLESLQDYLLTMPIRKMAVNGKRCDVNISSLNVTLKLTTLGKKAELEIGKENPTIAESCTVLRHRKLCGIMALSILNKFARTRHKRTLDAIHHWKCRRGTFLTFLISLISDTKIGFGIGTQLVLAFQQTLASWAAGLAVGLAVSLAVGLVATMHMVLSCATRF